MAQNEISEPRQRNGFEWDEHKRQINIAKHGIDFLDVPGVFDDPDRYTYRSRHPANEVRYVTVGRMRNVIVAIISTIRADRLRIISVRAARKYERERYEQGQSTQD